MALFCYEPQNRLTKTCTDWVLSHAQFQHKGTKAHELAVLTDIPADKCSAANGTSARSDVPRLAGTPSLEPWSDSVGKRIASYSQLIRCRFDVLSTFNCSDCVNKFGKTAELVSAYQDPARDDVFLLVFDKVLNALVLTFRATSCDGLQECIFNGQWLNNLDLAGTTVQYPNGQSYRMHGGFYRAWTGNLKSHAMTALKTAVAKYPPSNHSGLYVSGHSRGGAFANLAAMDIFFDAAQLGFTSPSSQIRLITLGQPRVGDANFAKLVQNSLGTRYRVVTNADVVTAVPPASDDWVLKALYLLGTFASDIENALNSANFYTHWGPQVHVAELKSGTTVQVCNDGECPKCAAAALLTLPFDRPWQDNFFTRVVNDHLTYLNTDLSNWECNRNGRSAVGGFEG